MMRVKLFRPFLRAGYGFQQFKPFRRSPPTAGAGRLHEEGRRLLKEHSQ